MASLRQTSFAGGELDPLLHGRHDIARYPISLKTCRNFFIARTGAAVTRSGTVFVNETKDSTKVSRLVPFIFSDGQALVLEVGHQYIRFFQNGGVVESSPGVAYELVTTYASTDVFRLKFSQSGDVITVTHVSYPPREIRRTTNTSWSIANASFAVPSSIISAATLYAAAYSYPSSAAAWSSIVTYATNAFVTSGGHTYASIQTANLNNVVTDKAWWIQLQDDITTGRTWQWAVTALVQDTAGVIHETSALIEDPATPVPVSVDQPVIITTSTGPAAIANHVWGFRIYRGFGKIFGFIGQQSAAGSYWDTGVEPDYTQQPPQGSNPFVSTTPGGGTIVFHRFAPPQSSTDYPACNTYFEQRRFFAGTTLRPNRLLGSAIGAYYDFDDRNLQSEDSPISFDISSRRLAQIRWTLPLQKLLLGTTSGVWSASGQAGSQIAFDSVDVKLQTELAASWLDPLQVDDSILFTRDKGTGVCGLVYTYAQQKYSVDDVSIYSQHLFVGHSVVDWAFALDPWGLVYAVREDGALLTCTYQPGQQTNAWARHDTDGTFESVCSVPEGLEDFVYVIVKRTINGSTKRFVERFASRVVTPSYEPSDYVGLDCSFAYSGAATTVISGLSHLEAKDVYALADGGVQGPFTVVAGAITLDIAAAKVKVGLKFLPQAQLLPPIVQGQEVRKKIKSVSEGAIEVYASRGLSVGPDSTHLTEWQQREVANNFDELPLETLLVKVPVDGLWDEEGGLFIQQNDPLPLTILAVTREVEFATY